MVKTKATKAIVAAVGTAFFAAGSSLITALADNYVSPAEWLTAFLAALVGSGIVGGATYQVTNQPKV